MKLAQFLNTLDGDRPPRAPKAILWIPPSGRPVECPSVEAAQNAATAYSAERPGATIAVYALVGYAFRPVEPPDFTPADSEKAVAELRDCGPDTLDSSVPVEGTDARTHRDDLTPEQRATLDRIGEAMREEGPA